MNNAIELTDVGWKAGEAFELQHISLRVPTGSIYGFLGPNGSGKTTTIRMFMGMLKPDHGEIRVLGRRVPKEMPRILARVGFVPERPHIYLPGAHRRRVRQVSLVVLHVVGSGMGRRAHVTPPARPVSKNLADVQGRDRQAPPAARALAAA